MIIDLFPLQTAVFPHQKLALQIFEPRYLKLINECYESSKPFGISLIQEGHEVGAPAIPFNIGTSVRIIQFNKTDENLYYITVIGEKRFKIKSIIHEQPHIQTEIEWTDKTIQHFPGDYDILRSSINNLLLDKTVLPEDDDELFGLIGTFISANPYDKQKILELPDQIIIPALIKYLELM